MIQNIFVNYIAQYKLNYNFDELQKISLSICKDKEQAGVYPDTPVLNNVVNEIKQKMNSIYTDYYKLDTSYYIEITQAWLNVNNNNNINVPHKHPGHLISGVFYINANSESESIEFINPNNAHQHVLSKLSKNKNIMYNEFTSSTWELQPETGMLILFPSWLMHYVKNKNNSSMRISLAIDGEAVLK